MTNKVWVCNCGIYWLWSEDNAREHEKKAKHKISEIELFNEDFRKLNLLILSNRIEHNKITPFPFTERIS